MKNNTPIGDRSVVVSILDSAPITILVPADLVVDGPALIQFVAREALTLHKQLIRGIDSIPDPIIWHLLKLQI